MSTALLVAASGAAGTLMRYGLGLWLAQGSAGTFPYGTFAANLIGCVLLGVVAEVVPEVRWVGVELRLLLGTGVLGGFTTYSAFNLEALRMFQQGHPGRAVGYMLLTVFGCLFAGWAGVAAGRALRG